MTVEAANNLRLAIDGLISKGAPALAAARLAELWRNDSGPAAAAFVCSRYESLRGQLPLTQHRTVFLRSFTLEPLIPMLRASAFCAGIDLAVHVGDFNTYAQDILDANSSLYAFRPDSVILAVRTPDIAPDLWLDYTALSAQAIRSSCERVSVSFEQWVRVFREHSSAALILHTLEKPLHPAAGILDAQSYPSQTEAIAEINRRLRSTAAQYLGVYLLDYDGLIATHGRVHWQDDRKYLIARLPVSAEHLKFLSHEWLRYLVPLSGRTAKALVVDLDNTLWGGIIGEDGINGIKLGPEYPGAAYQGLQRTMLDLSRRGILLAICSKNNPDEALEAIEKHPGMLLRSNHFAAMRISWKEKAHGLREIASELNIAVDSLAFLDDNPFEREQVRSSLPEVTVIELPDNPMQYSAAVRNCPVFERLALSAEDQHRSAMYAEQRQRAHAEGSFASKEDFFFFLNQAVEIEEVRPETQARLAQLTQKTNQFNLTTRRYSEQEICNLARRDDCHVFSLRVRDRFGDHGIVGVAITHDRGHDCEIDTFLLSCRVIGRTVETAFLAYICEAASLRGCTRILGRFLPTKKNAPARGFYSAHGFHKASEDESGSVWILDLKTARVNNPQWIKLEVMENTSAAKHS